MSEITTQEFSKREVFALQILKALIETSNPYAEDEVAILAVAIADQFMNQLTKPPEDFRFYLNSIKFAVSHRNSTRVH